MSRSARPAVTVVALRPDDWPRFRAIRQAGLKADPGAFAASAHEWLGSLDVEERWRSRLEQVTTFVALLEARDVGTAGVAPDGELLAMWVDPATRGAGVGSVLVRHVVETHRSRGASTPARLRVMAENAAAVTFYERCGFVLVNDEPDAEGCLDMTYAD